jgi:hypothetical protein
MNTEINAEMSMKCEAENYGKCGGHLNEHEVIWHVRPRSKDLERGHGAYDTTMKVSLCTEHAKRISFQHYGRLPELYGWDKWDALDGLTCYLDYTGFNPTYCVDCGCREKTTVSETGACTKTCKNLTELGADWEHCNCQSSVKCSCADFNNNKLHWAILTYGNGFEHEYHCEACVRPCWHDSHEHYKAGLMSLEYILKIAQEKPQFVYQKNAHGKTPLQLIRQLIELLLDAREGEYVKSAEYGWAGSNIKDLEKIEKKLKGGSASP